MKTIESRSLKSELKLGIITFVVGLSTTILFTYLEAYQIITLEDGQSTAIIFVTSSLFIYAPYIVASSRRELFFTEKDIRLKEYHYLLRFLMPRRTVTYTWDDVLAWNESAYVWDLKGLDPYCLDLLFRDGDEKKLYRLPGCFIYIDKKRIRYSEFKEYLAPFLEKVPQDKFLLRNYDKSLPIAGYASLFAGWLLIAGCIMGMVLASLGEPAPGLTVMAGFVGLFMLKISKQLFAQTKSQKKTLKST